MGKSVFDGVICFGGEDWWYHNRGHYDMQMMREISNNFPVVYINSIGMRVPRPGEGTMFFKRIARKLRSFSRGLRRINKSFYVFSPICMPPPKMSILLRIQIKLLIRWMGFSRPLLWVACPTAAEIIDDLNYTCLVYQRTDRYESYQNVISSTILSYDQKLKQRADCTVFCSRLLFDEERYQCNKALFTDHGILFDKYFEAGKGLDCPLDIRNIKYPRIGFVGGMDEGVFDKDFFYEVAKQCPDYQFVMIGSSSLPKNWCTLPNVYFLGQRPFTQVADYMASCDALIMTWQRNHWIKACNPIKLKEYLAVGRPIVTTPFDELDHYQGLLHVAESPQLFSEKIDRALSEPFDARLGQDSVRNHSWTSKAGQVLNVITRLDD